MALNFSDGMRIETSGELRITRKSDGLYVVGEGMCCPIDSAEEGREMIAEMIAEMKAASAPKQTTLIQFAKIQRGWGKSDWEKWEQIAQGFEAEGMDRSDAQGCADLKAIELIDGGSW
jgi:hypothetical protein